MNIARIKQLGCLLVCLGSVALAALPGDLNGDGLLNVPDLVRIQAMVGGIVSPSPEADLNFDGKVDFEDARLLENALRGNPLPVFLARATVGSAGGSLEHGGFRLDVPAGVLSAPGEIVLASINRQTLEDCGVSTSADSAPLALFGLPVADGLELSFRLPATRGGENWSLLLGNYRLPRGAEHPDWHFQLLDQPEDGVSIENGRLVWRPQRMPGQPATRAGAGKAEGFIFNIERNWLGGASYTSNHFRLQPLTSTMTDDEMNRMETLLRDLECAFSAGIDMGFPENRRVEKWGSSARKIKVVIKKPAKAKFYGLIAKEDAESAWCNAPGHWSPPYLELNTGVVTSARRREIVAHEFFHYLQFYYASNTTTLWLDELSATWMEGRVSPDGENYCPKYYINPRAPINGLYRAARLTERIGAGGGITEWLGLGGDTTNFHGYSASAFAYYLSKRHDWKTNFWHTVFSHADYAAGKGMAALQAGASSMSVGGLDILYLVFMRNYLSDGVSDAPAGIKPPFGSQGTNIINIFTGCADQHESDWKRFPQNGKVSNLENAGDLSDGQLEHDFQVQDMGAVTWLLKFPKPRELIKRGMYARVQVDDVCNDLFAVMIEAAKCMGITKIDSVKHDEDKKVRILEFSLAAMEKADRPMSIGLAAVKTNSGAGDSEALHPAKMTVQFLGRIALPTVTTWFGIYGARYMEASSDLEVTSDTPGVLGEYRAGIQPGGAFGTAEIGPRRNVYAQINKAWPQSVRIRSTIVPVDFGELTVTDSLGHDYTLHAVPTENAGVHVLFYTKDKGLPYRVQSFIVPLADLAAEGGYEVNLAPDNPTDHVGVEIRPIYTVLGNFTYMGENLTTSFTVFSPPPPANP